MKRAAWSLLALLPWPAPVFAQAKGKLPSSKVEVAIYRDKGVWAAESTQALPALLTWLGYSYRWLNAADIRAGKLSAHGKNAFQLLIVPGGWAGEYITALGGFDASGPGDDEIRNFVDAGGGYLGFCAGGFAAASRIRWAGEEYAYSWKLFDGFARGPKPWNPLKQGALSATHGTAQLDLALPELQKSGLPAVIRPLLYGGPSFELRDPKHPPRDFRVLARHGEDQSAAIISFRTKRRSRARVVLCSFHPAVLTDDGGRLDGHDYAMTAEGAGTDPDASAPDWKLAGVLVKLALGADSLKLPALPKIAGEPGPSKENR